jgi:uncharacterized YkwD family protein/spore coat assembly protein SafA
MKKWFISFVFVASILFAGFLANEAHAQQTTTYTVQPGDSMWKIAVRYQIGLSEIIAANPQIKNPALIYPNQKLTIPIIDDVKNIESQVISLTNQERAKHGLPALKADWELSRVARYKSVDMRDKRYFSHTSPTYGSPFTMMKNFGITYRTAAENIAQGQTTAQAVVQAWMNSPGHRANILNKSMTHIGVGYAKGGSGRHYWTQLFIGK